MKIDEVEVGVEYGVNERGNTRRSYYAALPRKVAALAIVEEVEEIWSGGGYGARTTRNVRRVEVEFLDEAQADPENWRANEIQRARTGSKLVVKASQLVAPWADLREDVAERIAKEQAERTAIETTRKRINALLPKRLRDEYLYVTASADWQNPTIVKADVRLQGEELEILLDLAEKGKAAK